MNNENNKVVFNSKQTSQLLNNNVIDDEALIDAYIGNSSDKLRTGTFSWCTFFLGIFYLVYRRMWLFALIVYIISIMIDNFVKSELLNIIIGIVVAIVAAAIFKNIYVSNVRKKVEKIKKENKDKSPEQLVNICSLRGGPSILYTLILIILLLIINLVRLHTEYMSYAEEEDSIFKDDIVNEDTKIKRGKLTLTALKGYFVTEDNNYTYKITYKEKKTKAFCILGISNYKANSIEEVEKALKDKRKLTYNEDVPIKEKTIDKATWKYIETKSYKYYATYYDGNEYRIEFMMYEDGFDNKCSNVYKEVLKSIEIE